MGAIGTKHDMVKPGRAVVSEALRKMRKIDPHVHFRDEEESHKYTIAEGMELARSHGIVAVCDMPNTKPPILTLQDYKRRLRVAGNVQGYYVHIGATSNPLQISDAARIVENEERAVGIKMYAGKSTNNLSVISEIDQRRVYSALADHGYRGVITVHCEKEELGQYGKWVPLKPYTWNSAKPPEMEIIGVLDQIIFVRETGFEGHLHIAHVTTTEAVRIIGSARNAGVRISCEVTPHHLTISTEDMINPAAIEYKVNPPIRDITTMNVLMELLRKEKIDFIATDHAPHTFEEKAFSEEKLPDSYMSGIRSMDRYSEFLQGLVNLGFTEEQIHAITYTNIKKVFTKIVE